jgi:hypothetical protein
MPAKEIVHDRCRALVRDDRNVKARFCLEQFGAHIAPGAYRRSPEVELAGSFPGHIDEFAD